MADFPPHPPRPTPQSPSPLLLSLLTHLQLAPFSIKTTQNPKKRSKPSLDLLRVLHYCIKKCVEWGGGGGESSGFKFLEKLKNYILKKKKKKKKKKN